jgi:hypothetical protein
MGQWPVASNNSILVSGVPLEFEFEAFENTIYPGMGVNIHTTNRWEAEMCDDGDNVTCIVDISMASLTGRGSWRADSVRGIGTATPLPYNDGDQMKCISGPVTVMLLLAVSQTIDEGEKLQCVGSGRFGAYVCRATADPCALVAEALEAVTTTSLQTAVYIHAKLLI